ncbi:metal-binding protein ZinT [Bacillus salipaludis]|uniref:Metal-binding protein ZinT n=1 Tax=Bacillus salipaludis TaxID=2547811 RepID=A0A4V3AT36_9BACI|nr:metal-binding protein ZinT [Bacillus salipaludis]MDQ6598905.1 metal-binding protein ZinT [Bacillus salipaludis]TDK58195.1 metal-binding protein ZinT [Bacillus salipaludis]
MKKEFIKSIIVFFLLGIILTGCQKEADSPVENASSESEPASSDSNSESAESTDHTHNHNHIHDDEKQKEIYSGIFEDDEVEDRELSDWEGDWQSVYPYLLDGTLDGVLQKKAETKKDKTFEEYKEYYKVGYETDIERIVIKDNTITFYKNGKGKTGEYKYHGYEFLTYESGNRGIRYLFDLVREADGVPKYVQFSDHSIYPTKTEHYHIYFGDEDHVTLFNELDNWPTYYFSNLSGEGIAEEMNAH